MTQQELKNHLKTLPSQIVEDLDNSLAYLEIKAIENNTLMELFEAVQFAKAELLEEGK